MRYIFSRDRPPSGAIPRFPIWEVTVMIFVIVAGVVGIVTPDSRALNAVLGPQWSFVWSCILIICGMTSLVGMSMPIPNGLIIHLAGMTLLTISAGSVATGIAIQLGNVFFPGAISLYVFAVGSLLRAAQMQYQLYRINRGLHLLLNRGDGAS